MRDFDCCDMATCFVVEQAAKAVGVRGLRGVFISNQGGTQVQKCFVLEWFLTLFAFAPPAQLMNSTRFYSFS